MNVRVFSVDFFVQGAITYPKDKHLHDLAVAYAEANLAKKVNLPEFAGDYRKLWASCEVDENDVPVRVIGLLGMKFTPDVPLLRYTEEAAIEPLIERANGYLHDQGARGCEVLLHFEKGTPESRCPRWKKWLKRVKAVNANRYSVTVR